MPFPPHIEDIYPLSPLQQGILFHTTLDPQGGDYVVQVSAELASWVDPQHLRRAWEMMIERHGILRTAFVWESLERPLQMVNRSVPVPWSELDWRGISPQEFEPRLATLLKGDRHRGFVLTKPPLLRITLITIGERRHYVLLSFHHILWDGWSFTQILKELGACCDALSAGRVPAKVERRPFRDYIGWAQRQDQRAAEEFWRDELAGLAGPSRLGLERLRICTDGAAYARVTHRLGKAAHSALADFARCNRLTLNSIVQGAWAILLARYGGRSDVVFGATLSGRPEDLSGADLMLGMFLNTIPVRVEVQESAVLQDWLGALQTRQLLAREYGFCQLAEIQRAVPYLGSTPLFDTIIDFKSSLGGTVSPGPSRSIFAGEVRSYEQTGYPLTLTASLQPELFLEADFDTTQYEAPAVSRILGHVDTLLSEMPRHAGGRLADLALLTSGERRAIESWSSGPQRPLRDTTFQDAFERQVRHSPGAIAVLTDDGRSTYSALNQSANRLARHLRALRIGPERRVGVCVERSIECVAALIAILKVGGVYVPLDPSYPRDRLSQHVRDAELDAMIITAATSTRAPETPATIIDLDRDAGRLAMLSDANPDIAVVHPLNLAYIMYTSGSTGVPKGAMVEVGGLLNHLQLMVDALGLEPSDVVAQTASTNFDISVWQLLTPLIMGGTVRIIKDDHAFDAPSLIERIRRNGITVLQLVPALVRALLEEERSSECALGPSLRRLITTGEAIAPELAQRWIEEHPDVLLVNAFGPAECSDDVTLGAVTEDGLRSSHRVPIGKPVENAELYVLGELMRMVPVGVIGELYIGGMCVGRGYLRNPRGTAAAFVPHPYAKSPGERLYRSGDLVRWRHDGSLEFIGRSDCQIKINGARVESGDIEAALAQHELVEQAIVEVVGEADSRVLVAYVVAAPAARNHAPDTLARDLRSYLRGKLPGHMVPGSITRLEAIPLSLNGKVDRNRLPQPAVASTASPKAWRQLTPTEQVMSDIWSLLLRVEQVSPGDDFFELGGHSLLAMQVISRAGKIFDCQIPLQVLFEASNLAEFTRAVENLHYEAAVETVRLRRVESDGPVPVSSSQRRLWMLMITHPNTALSNLPITFRLIGQLNETALAEAFEDVVARHESLRTRVHTHQGELVQSIDPPGPVPLPVVDLSAYAAGEMNAVMRRMVEEVAHWPFNPIEEHAIRAGLLRLAPGEHVLIIILNHLLADDVSCGLLLSDLAEAYEARNAGVPCPLMPLPIRFSDYVSCLQEWLGTAACVRQEAYWRRQLKEPLGRLNLPTSRPRTASLTFRFRRIRHRIPDGLYQQLKQMARTACATVFMTVLTAFKLLLFGHSGAHDIRVGTLMTNRHRPEMQEVIGPLIATLILRTDVSGNPRFSELLTRVQRTVIDAFAHCDLPLERVFAACGAGREPLRHPLVHAFFIFQQPADDSWKTTTLQAVPLPTDAPLADETEITSHELICEVEARPATLDFIFRYNADLFDDALIESFMADFERLLAAGTADPRQRIDSIWSVAHSLTA